MAHRVLHLVAVESTVAVHHELDVRVLRGKPLDANVFKPSTGKGLVHFLDFQNAPDCLP